MAGQLFAISGRIPTGALASGGLVAAILDPLNERDCLRRTSADQLKPVSTGTEKLRCSVPLVCDEALQDLALLIHGPPEMKAPSVDLHDDLVEASANGRISPVRRAASGSPRQTSDRTCTANCKPLHG